MTCNGLFKNEPTKIVDGLRYYSLPDSDYNQNYEKISADHLSASDLTDSNPWISEQQWSKMESSTLALVRQYASMGDKRSCRILDVGVGTGRLLSLIRNALPDIKLDAYGMDISENYLRKCIGKGLTVVYSRIEDMPFSDGVFDIVTCTDVLEHVLDLNCCVQKLLDVVRPGGQLIIRVPNREDLAPYLSCDYPYGYAHLRSFDEYALRLLFTKIFRTEVKEVTPGLMWQSSSLLKYRMPIPGYERMFRLVLKVVKGLSEAWYENLIRKTYYPLEINIVVQKSVV